MWSFSLCRPIHSRPCDVLYQHSARYCASGMAMETRGSFPTARVEGGDKQRLPITTTPPDIGRSLAIAQGDRPQVLARGGDDPHPTGTSAVEVPIQVHFHAIGYAGALVLRHLGRL